MLNQTGLINVKANIIGNKDPVQLILNLVCNNRCVELS